MLVRLPHACLRFRILQIPLYRVPDCALSILRTSRRLLTWLLCLTSVAFVRWPSVLSVNVNLSIENYVEFHYPVFTRALRSEGLPYPVLPLSVMLMMLLWVRGCATFQLQLDYRMAYGLVCCCRLLVQPEDHLLEMHCWPINGCGYIWQRLIDVAQ